MQGKGVLLSGPGTHITQLSAALREAQRLHAVIHYYPHWEMEFYDGRRRRLPFYRLLTWGMWAAWRRIPYWGRWDNPKTWHAALYDWLTAQYLPTSIRFVWGWSGYSLFTLQKARRKGLRTFLEFPTVHPAIWRRIIQSVYTQLSMSPTGLMHIPLSYINRIEQEITYADKVIILSSFAKQTLLQRGVSPEKLHWIPLGVEENLFTPASYLSQRPFRLLYVGRIDPLKGILVLLEAWKRLRLPQAELWIVGYVLPEIKPLLAQYEGLFHYSPALPREKLSEVYRQATAFVFPT
ncbi:MAG: glycosyltransferase family 4 protein, partial [Bacteroidia bacterium]|nr:glycosyltransferase family 4 protein [Bacteroidia bacterium]